MDSLLSKASETSRALSCEEIVRLLENGQVSLDESIKLYEEGVALVNSANMLLSSAKQKLITVTGDIISNE